MIEIYNIAARPYIGGEPMHTTSKKFHRAPHLRIYRLKEDASLPAIFNPLCSSIDNIPTDTIIYGSSTNQQLLKRTFVIKVATSDDFCNKRKPSRAIDTFRGEQR